MKIHTVAQDAFNALSDPKLIVKTPEEVPEALNYLVDKIADIMRADVCSLYLYESETNMLTLRATHGLNQVKVDDLQMKVGEGLCGLTLKLMKPISISNVKESKDFKFIPGLGEENLSSFLSIPLVYNQQPIGVMVVQNQDPTIYKKKDIHLLLSLGIPAVGVVERAKFLGALGNFAHADAITSAVTMEYFHNHHLKGIAAAAGIGMGRLKRIRHRRAKRRRAPTKQGTLAEIQRLKDAFDAVTADIQKTKAHAEKKFGPDEVSIFEAYLLFLESKTFQNQIIHEIETGNSAVKALQTVVKKYMDRMAAAGDEYIRERAYDIQDIARKISDNLLYGESDDADKFAVTEDTILLNDTWSVSDFVHIDTQHTKGIVSPAGGASSHISVLADSLSFPAVLGLGVGSQQIREGDYVIIDGGLGTVIVNPTQETVELYKHQIETLERLNRGYLKTKNDKIKLVRAGKEEAVPIGANIEMAGHVNNAVKSGADEIGLFRTEFPFLVRRSLPTEDEQYQLYRYVLRMMKKKPVTFRTLDIGGDKYISYLDLPKETNPALGWRSIRFSLERKDLFRIQLRALVKASIYGKMRLLFPMVSTMEQILEIEDILDSVKREVADEGCRFATNIPVGYMIEIPAAVEIAGKIARRADFLSIGTNDLVQYTLAVDRTNPKVANLYDPYHPAVIRLIHKTITAAAKEKTPVSICGDVAAKPLLVPIVWAMGVSSLSMNPSSIPKIKSLMQRLRFDDANKLLERVLEMDTGIEIRAALKAYFDGNKFGEYLDQAVGEEAKG